MKMVNFMYDYIRGKVEKITSSYITLDCNGVGYLIYAPNPYFFKLKEEYTKVLKDNYLYDELDNDINDVVIKKVEVYAEEKAIKNLRLKYPKVIVKKIVIKN